MATQSWDETRRPSNCLCIIFRQVLWSGICIHDCVNDEVFIPLFSAERTSCHGNCDNGASRVTSHYRQYRPSAPTVHRLAKCARRFPPHQGRIYETIDPNAIIVPVRVFSALEAGTLPAGRLVEKPCAPHPVRSKLLSSVIPRSPISRPLMDRFLWALCLPLTQASVGWW